MKSYFLLIFLLIISVTSFSLGKQEVLEELPRIRNVVLNCWGSLTIEQGEENRLTMQTTDYLQSKLKNQIFGDTLVLSVEGLQTGLNRSSIDYHLVLQEINSIENRSDGKIVIEPVK